MRTDLEWILDTNVLIAFNDDSVLPKKIRLDDHATV